MLNITKITPRGKAANSGAAMLEYLKATEYYRDKDGADRSSSIWFGAGAAALGLDGVVAIQDMDKLASGFDPKTDAPLVQNAGEKPVWRPEKDNQGNVLLDRHGKERGRWDGRIPAFDLTFSAPKSLSVLFAAAEGETRDSLLAAHSEAVRATLGYLEQRLETRRGKGGRDVLAIEGMAASLHTHFASREVRGDGEVSQDCGDPQVHTHALLYNVCKGADGQWATIDGNELFAEPKALGALYRSELAANLKSLGYGIQQERQIGEDGEPTGDVYYEIAGVSQEIRDHFSRRRQSVEAYMRNHQVDAQQAALATRKNKDEPTFSELSEIWQQTIDGLRRDNPDLLPDTAALRQQPDQVQPLNDQQIVADLEANNAVWTRHDLLKHLAQERPGLRIADLVQEVDAFAGRNGIERVAPEQLHIDDQGRNLAKRHTEDRFASQAMIAVEQQMLARAEKRIADRQHVLPAEAVGAAVQRYEQTKGFTLAQEQRVAVDHLTQKEGGVSILAGRAGTGKTSTIGAAVEAWQEAGYQVQGLSTAWQAAKKLQAESGIQSRSIQSFLGQLRHGKTSLSQKSVIIVDEAGMVGTRDLARVQEAVDKAGGKLVLMGDHHQLQSVSAGGPLRLLAQKVGSATLGDIRRQQWREGLDAAKQFYDAPDRLRSRSENRELGNEILAKLKRAATIVPAESIKQAREDLTADWLADKRPAGDKLIIAGTRRDVDALNQNIREGLRSSGRVGAVDHTISVQRGSAAAASMPVAEGDRLRFSAKDRDLGTVNGTVAVVERIVTAAGKPATIHARIESDIAAENGRRIAWKADQAVNVGHGYAMTVHKSQGQGAPSVYQLAHRGMTDRHLQLVAFTRAKQSFRLYGSDQDLDERLLSERMATDRLKLNAIEQRRPQPVQVKPQVMRRLAATPDTSDALRQRMQAVGVKLAEVGQRMRKAVGLDRSMSR